MGETGDGQFIHKIGAQSCVDYLRRFPPRAIATRAGKTCPVTDSIKGDKIPDFL